MGIPVSFLLIAVGAILAFAVNQDPNQSVDIDVVGWILLVVGVAGLLLSLLLWESWGPGYWGWHQRGYTAEGPYPARRRGYPRRRVIEEEEGPGPPGPPPPDAPPPP